MSVMLLNTFLTFRGEKFSPLSSDELEVQIALGTLPSKYIRIYVKDPEILDKLANLPDEQVRFAVAGHPNVSLDTLMKMVKDPSTSTNLLILLAAHSKMPLDEIYKFTKHKNPLVNEEARGILFIRSKGRIDIQDD